MENRTYLLLVVILFSFPPSLPAAALGDATVMSAIASSLAGVPPSWNSGTDPCRWEGIKCTSGRITSVDLNSKSIYGTIPDSVSELSSLQNLDLGHNQISGPIPSLAGLSSLQTLNLESNSFTSLPTNFFSGLTRLRSVSLDNNPLHPWSIPIDLADCIYLQSFSAANATVTGGIPDVFSQQNLTNLNLSYNDLTGELPSLLAGSSIQRLYLNDQQNLGLSGSIDVVGAMLQLELVWLQSNCFTGAIPDLANLTSLMSFNVRDNKLTGPVPASLTSCLTLKDVVLSNNLLQGPFPVFSDNVEVDVSDGNRFCNPCPQSCDPRVTTLLSMARGFGYPKTIAESWKGNDPCSLPWTGVTCDRHMKGIVVIDLSSKHLGGTISPDIANLTSLTDIILRDNNLTGPIPDSLIKLPQLQLLDVTNNRLTGKIPEFPPTVSLKASGNPTPGKDLSPAPSAGGSNPPSPGKPTSSLPRNTSGTAIIWTLIGAIFILVGCSVCCIYYQWHKNCTKISGCIHTRSPPVELEPFKISMEEMNAHGRATTDLYKESNSGSNEDANMVEAQTIEFQALQSATNNFAEANILGRGGFGVVYKGEHNGAVIAVKRNVSDFMDNNGKEELQAEIDFLGKVRHRHLVKLLGYCVNGNERLLVYEYMPKGTLTQHLFCQSEEYSALSWKQRLRIALDVAHGIEYLHSLGNESFIHRDLKPSNILLDNDMRAKVSDFGLVKLVDSEKSMMTRVAGTFGYLAPEYVITGKVSTKVDVYAFGVILMELITGRKALDGSLPDDESILVTFFHKSILNKENFMKHVDPTLFVEEEAFSSIPDIAELACLCTAREANQRPGMNHVVKILHPFVNKWNPICYDAKGKDDSSLSLTVSLTH